MFDCQLIFMTANWFFLPWSYFFDCHLRNGVKISFFVWYRKLFKAISKHSRKRFEHCKFRKLEWQSFFFFFFFFFFCQFWPLNFLEAILRLQLWRIFCFKCKLFSMKKTNPTSYKFWLTSSHQYLTNVQCCSRRFGRETVHPTQKFTLGAIFILRKGKGVGGWYS